MAEKPNLNHPWMVAVWPGMGNVALNAGVYLLAKLGMTAIAEFEGGDLFDVAQVEVKHGLIQPARRPRNSAPLNSPHLRQIDCDKQIIEIARLFASERLVM